MAPLLIDTMVLPDANET